MTQGQALALSLALEVPCVVALMRVHRPGAHLWRVVAVGAAATLLSHPVVWHGMLVLQPLVGGWWARAGLVEVGAWLAEAVVFVQWLGASRRGALVVSAVANALSFGVGLGWLWWSSQLG